MNIKHAFIISSVIGASIPIIASGQVRISEIMYDPAGTDTKREWIEVVNTGTSSVDLATYFLFEAGVFHKLVAVGSALLGAGEFAIIADSPADVRADYPSYDGLLFDSAFSLVNTGEALGIANAQKETVDSVTYDASMGGTGDGQSLQMHDGTILHAAPTFGDTNKTESETVAVDIQGDTSGSGTATNTQTNGNASTHSQQEPAESYTPSGPFKVGAGRNRKVLVHVPTEFRASLSKPDQDPSFAWNFGDFSTKRGRTAHHTYLYPGTYQVVLEAKNNDHTAVSRTEVTVLEPDLEFMVGSSSLSIANKLSDEVNIGLFVLEFVSGRMRVPENTILKGQTVLTVPHRDHDSLLEIRYPDDTVYKRMGTSTDLVQYEH